MWRAVTNSFCITAVGLASWHLGMKAAAVVRSVIIVILVIIVICQKHVRFWHRTGMSHHTSNPLEPLFFPSFPEYKWKSTIRGTQPNLVRNHLVQSLSVPARSHRLVQAADNRRRTNLPDQIHSNQSCSNAVKTSDLICKCSSPNSWCIACR